MFRIFNYIKKNEKKLYFVPLFTCSSSSQHPLPTNAYTHFFHVIKLSIPAKNTQSPVDCGGFSYVQPMCVYLSMPQLCMYANKTLSYNWHRDDVFNRESRTLGWGNNRYTLMTMWMDVEWCGAMAHREKTKASNGEKRKWRVDLMLRWGSINFNTIEII